MKINPASYQLAPRRKEEPMDLAPPLPREVTPPTPPPPEATPPRAGELREPNGDVYVAPAIDRSKTAQYLDTVEDEDLVVDV